MTYNEDTNLIFDTQTINRSESNSWGEDMLGESNSTFVTKKKKRNPGETPLLDTYGVSLNKSATEGKLDPVFGRDEEIQRILQILCRKKKNNPLLLGDPGVGKTAVVEALAQRIVAKQVPLPLLDKVIVSLEINSIVAGTAYRGQFEERLKGIIEELKEHPEIILYIDEIHTIIGSGNPEGALDTANILKPALARGEVQCIGATTLDEYRKSIGKVGALDRRFQKVTIAQPSETDTLKMLHHIKSSYEQHHKVTYTDEAIKACVRLTDRYVSDRNQPDKAIDALDEAGAYAYLAVLSDPTELQRLESTLLRIHEAKLAAVNDRDYELATKYRDEEHAARKALDEYIESLKNSHETEGRPVVDVDVVERVVAITTGIPLESFTRDDLTALGTLEQRLSAEVIGQAQAVHEVSSAIQRNKVGLRDPFKPIGTFLFLGSSGVGKTHLTKQIARELFGSEDALIRVDMSEFMERHSVSRLIGAPPGYVGYDEGGELTEKVLRRPYSVILFDEIEKANAEVHNLLLQLLDDGILTDGSGRKVSFKNCVVIMTSNVGTRQLKEFGEGIGFKDIDRNNHEDLSKGVIDKALKRAFSPEFLNRIDRIVTFNSLSQEDIESIVDIELDALGKRLEAIEIALEYTPSAKQFIVHKGYDPQYGARPLKRAITKYVEELITQALIDRIVETGGRYLIDYKDKEPTLKILEIAPALI